jgi:hypothetical protein
MPLPVQTFVVPAEYCLALIDAAAYPSFVARGKHVHLGRVNGRSRLRLALRSGCDSVDGSSLSRFPRTWIPKFVTDLKGLEQEVALDQALLRELRRQLRGFAAVAPFNQEETWDRARTSCLSCFSSPPSVA